jgi:hypothetical protein
MVADESVDAKTADTWSVPPSIWGNTGTTTYVK